MKILYQKQHVNNIPNNTIMVQKAYLMYKYQDIRIASNVFLTPYHVIAFMAILRLLFFSVVFRFMQL